MSDKLGDSIQLVDRKPNTPQVMDYSISELVKVEIYESIVISEYRFLYNLDNNKYVLRLKFSDDIVVRSNFDDMQKLLEDILTI